MSYFTREQEAKAVEIILKECTFGCSKDGKKKPTSMAYVERNEDGYVVALVDLGRHQWNVCTEKGQPPPPKHWKMPPSIGYLTHLQRLSVYHCKGLPREIMHLADSLQEIAFHSCNELDFEKDVAPEFQNLRLLTDFRIHGGSVMSQRILPIPTLRNLCNLRYLYYRGPNETEEWNASGRVEETNNLLVYDLLHPQVTFKDSLEILDIQGGNLVGETVGKLVTQVLPRYGKLQRLVLPNNRIRSLAPILDEQSSPAMLPRLRCLNLLGNPVLGSTLSQGDLMKERSILLRLLSLHQEISSLGRGITESAVCSADILLALDRNDGGAILLSDRFRQIPLSVWSIVLERANHRKGYYDTANVIYHLLRNGPVLGLQRRHPAQKSYKKAFSLNELPSPTTTTCPPMRMTSIHSLGPGLAFLTNVGSTPRIVLPDTRKRKISLP